MNARNRNDKDIAAGLTQVRVIDAHEVFQQLVDFVLRDCLAAVDWLDPDGLVGADPQRLRSVLHTLRTSLVTGGADIGWKKSEAKTGFE